MKDSLDPRFNCRGSEGELGSHESPSEPDRDGIHSSQPGLLDQLWAMFITARIVRDHVRDYVKAALVRATPVMATLVRVAFIRARIVRHWVRVQCHSRDHQGQCQNHINQTTMVRDHTRAVHIREGQWWIRGSCWSTSLMRQISIVSEWSHTAAPHVKQSFHLYVHISEGQYTCVEYPLLSPPT